MQKCQPSETNVLGWGSFASFTESMWLGMESISLWPCWGVVDFKQLGFCASQPFQTETLISKWNERQTSFLTLGKTLLTFFSGSGVAWHEECNSYSSPSPGYVCLDALPPASAHSLWSSHTFWIAIAWQSAQSVACAASSPTPSPSTQHAMNILGYSSMWRAQ